MDMNGNAQGSHLHCGSGASGGVFPVAEFSTFHLLKNYNYLIAPRLSDFVPKQILASTLPPDLPLNPANLNDVRCVDPSIFTPRRIFSYSHCNPIVQHEVLGQKNNVIPNCHSLLNQNYRRQRGEKKPIPEELKDDKYFERRKRNNQAAKKSRDARKQREDQIALRATLLEHENALLKTQLLTLREEASSLRQLLLEKKTLEFSSKSGQL